MQWTPETIRDLRLAMGMSQGEFARVLDVQTNAVNRWENGRRRPQRPRRIALDTLFRAKEAALAAA